MTSALCYDKRNALNAICPYFTMFPLEYPLRVLRAHRRQAAVVMDPFCGRGTTLFAARQLGLQAYGVDTSPVAIAIAKAKLCEVNVDATICLAREYVRDIQPSAVPASDFFRHAFDPSVLRDVCSIREGLLNNPRDTDAAVLLRAAMLGCLHGPKSKHIQHQAYFSNQMPRTFASKPDYSVRYWKRERLRAPKADVISVLQRKLLRIARSTMPRGVSPSRVRIGDSRLASSLPPRRDFSIVVTSPPYYGMTTYVQDQWLRNWFLGGPDYVEYANTPQLEHGGHDVFAESLGAVWRNMARARTDELHMYIRFGLIPSARANPKGLLRASLEASGVPWRVVSTRQASTAASGKRQADLMAADSAAATEYDFHVIRI